MINLLLVDDHELVIDGIRTMLESESDLHCVAVANEGQSALDILQKEKIDVVLLDVNMPGMNGLDMLKALRKKDTDTKVLVLTMLQETSLIKLMLRCGANGFVLKNTGKEELIHAIHKVFNGERYLGQQASSMVLEALGGDQRSSRSTSVIPKLSRREKQILGLIVDEFTTQEIADKLFISFGTVETHRRNILLKLGARNTAGIVRAALELNLLDTEKN